MKTKRVICLYGGPGTGKSTTAAGIFYKLKLAGYDAEMNREYVKDWVWEGRNIKSGDQPYLISKQARKDRLYMENNVDFIVTDSPLLLSEVYAKLDPSEGEGFGTVNALISHHHNFSKEKGYKIDHFFLTRSKDYNPNGRTQTEDEAKELDAMIKQVLDDRGVVYHTVEADENAVDTILSIMENLGKIKERE